MSDRGLNPYIKVLLNFYRSLKPEVFRKRRAKLIGQDHLGNKYYESMSTTKPMRFFTPPHVDKWDEPLPAEWNAWLRMTRKDPPTPEELMKNLKRIESLKSKYTKTMDYDESGEITQKQKSKFPTFEEYEQNPGSKYNKFD